MNAIDLYAGVGGWALGLKLAGIDVTHSYEWWHPALATHATNNGGHPVNCDIRDLDLNSLPKEIDIVVGSPPCTQFSFSNRGGGGDIVDGLVDIERFLDIVAFLNPRAWAMENVPRVKGILDRELQKGGRLYRFRTLEFASHIIDMSEFGLPQRRKRCIAGNFDFDLLLSYRRHCPQRTLGDVLTALNSPRSVVDPIYGLTLPAKHLVDNDQEPPLNPEEERMNREAKLFHPVYNNMEFPDPQDAPCRTITATCTRVSRESVVVRTHHGNQVRRLSVRERATLQGFPITYQFFGNSHAEKLKMVGNAIPPVFAFYIGQALEGVEGGELVAPSVAIQRFSGTTQTPPTTKPDEAGQKYPATRRFRSAIPTLRFKSGVRFEFGNEFECVAPKWVVRFFFGNSKNIRECILGPSLLRSCCRFLTEDEIRELDACVGPLRELLRLTDDRALQGAWTKRSNGVHPYEVVDCLGDTAQRVLTEVRRIPTNRLEPFVLEVLRVGSDRDSSVLGGAKIRRYVQEIFAGFVIGSHANIILRLSENFDEDVDQYREIDPALDEDKEYLLTS